MTLEGHGLLCRLKHNVQKRADSLAQKERREHGKPALTDHVVNKYLSTRSGARYMPSPGTTLMNGLRSLSLKSTWLSWRAGTETHHFLTSPLVLLITEGSSKGVGDSEVEV